MILEPLRLFTKNANVIAIFLCASVLAGIQGVGKMHFHHPYLQQFKAALAEWGAKNKGWKDAYILLDTAIEYNKGICYGLTGCGEKSWSKSIRYDVQK